MPFSLYLKNNLPLLYLISITNQNIQTDLSRRTAAPGEFSEISPEHVRIVANTLFIGSYSLATVDTVYGSMEQSLMCHRRTLLLLQVIQIRSRVNPDKSLHWMKINQLGIQAYHQQSRKKLDLCHAVKIKIYPAYCLLTME